VNRKRQDVDYGSYVDYGWYDKGVQKREKGDEE
jgi:hypothetical protein